MLYGIHALPVALPRTFISPSPTRTHVIALNLFVEPTAPERIPRLVALRRGVFYELLHPMRCKGWSFTGRMNPRLGQFLTGY